MHHCLYLTHFLGANTWRMWLRYTCTWWLSSWTDEFWERKEAHAYYVILVSYYQCQPIVLDEFERGKKHMHIVSYWCHTISINHHLGRIWEERSTCILCHTGVILSVSAHRLGRIDACHKLRHVHGITTGLLHGNIHGLIPPWVWISLSFWCKLANLPVCWGLENDERILNKN